LFAPLLPAFGWLAFFQLSIILLTAVRFGHIRGSDFSTPMTSSFSLLPPDVDLNIMLGYACAYQQA